LGQSVLFPEGLWGLSFLWDPLGLVDQSVLFPEGLWRLSFLWDPLGLWDL